MRVFRDRVRHDELVSLSHELILQALGFQPCEMYFYFHDALAYYHERICNRLLKGFLRDFIINF